MMNLCTNCHGRPAWEAAKSAMCIGCLKDQGYLDEVAKAAGLEIPTEAPLPDKDAPRGHKSIFDNMDLSDRIKEIQAEHGFNSP